MKLSSRADNKKEFIDKLKTLSLPSGTKVGVLLLHGLTGMPNEMRPVAKAMEKIGCQVEVPMLPGHGAGQKELLATGWREWFSGASKALNNLSQTCDQIVIGGLSMGALLPVLLAAENPKVTGIISMSPTIKYDSKDSSNPFKVLLPLVDLAPFLGRIFYWTESAPYGLRDERLVRKITKEIEEAKKGNKKDDSGFNPDSFRTYAHSLRQLQKLVGQVQKQAPKVNCSALIIQSKEDSLTTTWNAETLYKWLGTNDKQIIFMEGCDHVLTADLKKEEVAYHCAAFVCRVAAANAAQAAN